jgi:hypothetical protein
MARSQHCLEIKQQRPYIGLFANEISTHSLDEITIHGISWYIGEANANIVWILGAWKEVQ